MSEYERRLMEWDSAADKIREFLQRFVTSCGMELTYVVRTGSGPDGIGLSVEFSGPDAMLLAARNGELLHALESVATGILRLTPEQHDQISFDADGYKARRAQQMRRSAQAAVSSVETTGRPYTFPPMNSRERRMLHLELAGSGLRTASTGEASRRCVVLYPAQGSLGPAAAEVSEDRVKVLRDRFRPRS